MTATAVDRSSPFPVPVEVIESFEAFVRREQRSLVAPAFGLIGDAAEAQDVVQDVLVAASSRWSSIARRDSPTAWARRAVMNRSTSVIRRRAAEARRMLRLRAQATEAVSTPMPDESEQLWAAVRQLPRRQAQAVVLRAVMAMTVQEVAEVLGVTKPTAQTHLERGLAALRNGGFDVGDS